MLICGAVLVASVAVAGNVVEASPLNVTVGAIVVNEYFVGKSVAVVFVIAAGAVVPAIIVLAIGGEAPDFTGCVDVYVVVPGCIVVIVCGIVVVSVVIAGDVLSTFSFTVIVCIVVAIQVIIEENVIVVTIVVGCAVFRSVVVVVSDCCCFICFWSFCCGFTWYCGELFWMKSL